MVMFKAVCPHCSAEYLLNDSLLGKTAHCKQCRQIFTLTADDTATSVPKQVGKGARHDSGFEISSLSESNSLDKIKNSGQIPSKPKSSKRVPAESGVWNIGDIILGMYEVKELAPGVPFAEGGVGVVHRVRHREWDRDLAVKSPKPQIFQTESGKQSYEKEAQTWIELGLHPNIVTCYLVRRIGNIPRLFAEFVGDGSLRDWIKDGRLYKGGRETALLRILNIAVQFAWGLEHAHSQKLLHLDIKPANVMMSGQTPKVTDFGLARGSAENHDSDAAVLSGEASASGMTPGYCSPEQYLAFMYMQRKEYGNVPAITVQSDIWSWAVSVLAMFHGRPPCKKGGQTARKVFEQYLKIPPDNDRPGMPEGLVDVMRHCFEEEPENRPDSIAEVADKLAAIYEETAGVPFPLARPASATWTPESINNRAASMLDLGKPDEAIKLLNEAAQILPWHPEVTYNQTLLAWRSGQLTDLEAVERLETLVKTRPQSAEALYALGLAQRERGNLQNALDSFEGAAALQPREDFRRSIFATEKLASKSSRCVERINLAAGLENGILLDNAGEFILLPASGGAFTLREALTGKTVNTFILPKPEQQKQNPLRAAVSSDLLWELLNSNSSGEDDEQFILRPIGSSGVSRTFYPVKWKRYFNAGDTDKITKSNDDDEIITDTGVPYIGKVKDNYAVIYDKKTKKIITQLFGHEDAVSAMVFNENGHFALTGSKDRTLRLWELPSGRCIRTFTSLGGAVDAVQFCKNSNFALSLIAGGSIRLWDISVLCGSTSFHAPLLLSNIASSEEVSQQQSEINQCCVKIREAVKKSNFADAADVYKKLSSMNGWESARNRLETEGILDVLSRKTVRTSLTDVLCTQSFTGHHDVITSAVLSLDGNLAATAGRDNTIRIWNLAERKCAAVLEGHYDWVRSIALTMDAKFIVSGSWDMSVRIWNIRAGKEVKRFDEKIKSLTKITLNPQGRIVAIANGQGAIILWDVLNENIIGRFLAHNGSVNSIRFSRNGHYFATGGDDNKVCVWRADRKSGELIRTITAHNAPVTEAVLSTDLSTLISADREGKIVVWDLLNNKLKFNLQGHFGDVTGLELLANEQFFLSASKDKKLRFEGITNRSVQRIVEGHPAPVLCLAADIPGKRCITGSEDAVVRVWDLYWDYDYKGQTAVTLQAEKTLKTLLSLYSPDASAKDKPKVDETILKRIFLEMEYRGYGTIPQEKLHSAVQDIIEHWNGTQSLISD